MVSFPFSNDDSIDAFRDAMDRTETEDYQQATNRTAVIIGESALATNIQHIKEETIVLLDSSVPMVQHMTNYVDLLRDARDATAWKWQIGVGNNKLDSQSQARYGNMLREQIEWWERSKEPHALRTPSMFKAAQTLAREKAIIPWHGDITSDEDMARLGIALRKLDATVTLLNLSNVIPFTACAPRLPSFPTAAGYADKLTHLPTVPNVPILTTSLTSYSGGRIVESTGPFSGLDDLRDSGGDSTSGPVAIRPSRNIYPNIPRQDSLRAVWIRL